MLSHHLSVCWYEIIVIVRLNDQVKIFWVTWPSEPFVCVALPGVVSGNSLHKFSSAEIKHKRFGKKCRNFRWGKLKPKIARLKCGVSGLVTRSGFAQWEVRESLWGKEAVTLDKNRSPCTNEQNVYSSSHLFHGTACMTTSPYDCKSY